VSLGPVRPQGGNEHGSSNKILYLFTVYMRNKILNQTQFFFQLFFSDAERAHCVCLWCLLPREWKITKASQHRFHFSSRIIGWCCPRGKIRNVHGSSNDSVPLERNATQYYKIYKFYALSPILDLGGITWQIGLVWHFW
jgi:hypothetical protein